MLIAHYSVFTPYFSNKWYIFIFGLSSSGKQIRSPSEFYFWIKNAVLIYMSVKGDERVVTSQILNFFYSKFQCFPKKFTPLMPDSYILFLQCQIKLNSSWHLMSELAAAFLPHVRLVLSHYQTDKVLSMLKFGLIKKKEDTWPFSSQCYLAGKGSGLIITLLICLMWSAQKISLRWLDSQGII